MKTITLKDCVEYEKNNSIKIDDSTSGYKTEEQSSEYAKLYMKWWGSNLVFIGHDIVNGLYVPKFNIFD